MGEYAQAAEFYDLLYADIKDHAAEVALLTALIRERNPDAVSLLDVGCGTGSHARAFIDAGFRADGVDLEPSFVEIARTKCPEGRFFRGDMTSLAVDDRYDIVTCLFSAIGYVRTEPRLQAAIAGMRALLRPRGLLIVDPWFEPGQLTDGWISTAMGKNEDLAVFRMSRTVIEGVESRLHFEYLIGRRWSIERRSETHTLGLFTQAQMESAFAEAGLRVRRLPEVLRTRGLYVAAAE